MTRPDGNSEVHIHSKLRICAMFKQVNLAVGMVRCPTQHCYVHTTPANVNLPERGNNVSQMLHRKI